MAWQFLARRVFSAVAVAFMVAVLAREGHAQPVLPVPAAGRTVARISIALIDVPLVEALETLSREARLNLVWQAATLGERATVRISCRLEQALPEDALACVTKAAGFDYVRLSSGTYVVIAGAEQPTAWASLGGRVLDASSGAPLPQARVQLAEASESVVASDDGGFSFPRLRPGTYQLIVRAVGYRPYREVLELPPRGAALLRLPMARAEGVVRPIIVNGLRAGAASATLGGTSLADSAVRRTLVGPALFLPGAAVPLGVSRRDGTGDLHLQGGDLGEHPWRIDGIPLYDVSSLSGLLGIVSPTAIEALHVQRSGFRASAGSYATGVIDLRHALSHEVDTPSAEVTIDPMAVAGRLVTPVSVGSARGQAMVAGRTGLWPWTAPAALARAMRHWSVPDPVLLARLTEFSKVPGMEGLESAAFRTGIADENLQVHDLHTAARLQVGVGHTISASGLLTQQRVSYRGAAHDGGVNTMQSFDRYDKQTFGAQLTHEWLIGTRVRQQLQFRVSRHALQHGGAMSMNTAPLDPVRANEDNGMTELALQGEWRVQSGSRTELLLGTEVAHNRAHLDLANRVLRPLAYSTAVTRATLIADVTRQLRGERFLDAGLRVTQLQTGRTFAEPRLAVRGERVMGAQSLAWRVAAGGYHQFVNQFDVASTMPVAFVPSVRFWLPSDGTVPVAQAWHVSGEAAYRPATGWELRGEVYARWHPSLPMFDYGVMYGGAADASSSVAATSFARRSVGRAVGGGVRLLREATWLGMGTRTELAYDAGSAARRFPSRFDEQAQPPAWLEPHRALLSTELRPTRHVVIAGRARGVWGRPWALRQAYYDLFGAAPMMSNLPLAMPASMRRPAIVDLDFGATWELQLGRTRMELGASVLNAANRRNVLDFGLRRVESGGYAMVPRFMPTRQSAVTLRLGL